MKIEVVPLPLLLKPNQLAGRTVVVIDVLRATSVIATMLANGAAEVRTFEDIDATRDAAVGFEGPKLLAGERLCKPIDGFDVGNSPREMTAERVAGRTVFMTTTNGTRAILAASGAAEVGEVVTAAFVNRAATADYVRRVGRDVTILCAGTDRQRTAEDELLAEWFFGPTPDVGDLERRLLDSQGGHNVVRAGLAQDVRDCAKVDSLDVVCGVVRGTGNVVRRVG